MVGGVVRWFEELLDGWKGVSRSCWMVGGVVSWLDVWLEGLCDGWKRCLMVRWFLIGYCCCKMVGGFHMGFLWLLRWLEGFWEVDVMLDGWGSFGKVGGLLDGWRGC